MSEVTTMQRERIADAIVQRLASSRDRLREQFAASCGRIGYFVLDDVLPSDLAGKVYEAFPAPQLMTLKRSLREYKYIAAQMDRYDRLLEEALFAFQDWRVLDEIEVITGLTALEPDPELYAGGISVMVQDHFLNPHIDNSHDKDRSRWRVLNALFYVTPGWQDGHGGHLELWPQGPGAQPLTLHSRFNRLVVMATHADSWHSVSPVRAARPRCCVSNYYFRRAPVRDSDRFHVTSFRGRPEQPLRDLVLQMDAGLRGLLRRAFRKGLGRLTHLYRR